MMTSSVHTKCPMMILSFLHLVRPGLCLERAVGTIWMTMSSVHTKCRNVEKAVGTIWMTMSSFHTKCRNVDKPYPASENIHRISVPDEKVPWTREWNDYSPIDYTDPKIEGKDWADPGIDKGKFKWNEMDGKINRTSHTGTYETKNGRPLNPEGRTGLAGRGKLGRWGPNHAADPIVTRLNNGHLEFVAIQRGDCGEWALPGGMVDPGEEISQTLTREFSEEALDGAQLPDELTKKGHELYRGYVDDPRNTDNAWMETVCVNFHDDANGKYTDKLELKAGSDAANVRWIKLPDENLKLYASHQKLVDLLVQHHRDKKSS